MIVLSNAVLAFLTVGWILSVVAAVHLTYHYTRHRLRQYVKYHMDKNAVPEYRQVRIRVEKQDEILFAYQCDTGEFLAQSSSAKELVRLLKEYFSDQVTSIKVTEGLEYIQKYT